MTRALITGFEPFGPNPVNPTQALVELLQANYSGRGLEAQLLPVTFTGARGRIQALIEAKTPPRLFYLVGFTLPPGSCMLNASRLTSKKAKTTVVLAPPLCGRPRRRRRPVCHHQHRRPAR